MSQKSTIAAIASAILFTALTLTPQARADAILDDQELSSEIARHRAIDSVEVGTIREPLYSVGWVFVRSEPTFSMEDLEIQKIADYSAKLFRAKYPQTTMIQIKITGERDGFLHTITFEERVSGSVVREEVTCSDPRCKSEVFFNFQFTG